MRGGSCATRSTLKKRDLGLDLRLVNQHDRQAVPNGIDAVALRALQALWVLTIFQIRFAGRANQHF